MVSTTNPEQVYHESIKKIVVISQKRAKVPAKNYEILICTTDSNEFWRCTPNFTILQIHAQWR